MQVDQVKFIWLGNQVHALGVEQDSSPIVTIHLRPNIDITHNYKKDNRVEIVFLKYGLKYFIPNQYALEEVIRLHLMNKDAEDILKKHCKKYFKEV